MNGKKMREIAEILIEYQEAHEDNELTRMPPELPNDERLVVEAFLEVVDASRRPLPHGGVMEAVVVLALHWLAEHTGPLPAFRHKVTGHRTCLQCGVSFDHEGNYCQTCEEQVRDGN